MRIALLTILAAIILFPSGCAISTNGDGDANPALSASPVGKWTLTKIEDENYDLPSGARTPTLTITADGAISGQAGINRYNGKINADAMDQGQWDAGGIVTTKMAGEIGAMTFEQRFIAMLQRADSIAATERTLDLMVGERELLRFSRAGQ
ncbi:MAG: META domain-containing protein [Phycisphaera sp.]|nr:MAG: META domain-containing protein [Phycisphaera sp.]